MHMHNVIFSPDVCVVFLGDRLIHLVDDLGVKLAVTSGDGILSTSSLVVAVKTVNGSNFTTILFDVFNTDHVQVVICSSKDIGSHMRAFFKINISILVSKTRKGSTTPKPKPTT